MEDCCIVCAEPLEWVGYGICGHQDVCSMCIARLRFILNERRCCICKQECSSVFVTKALGKYTKFVNDFATLHENGALWYEKNIQAFFDDKNQFAMIKAMCRLLCRVCEEGEGSKVNKDFVKKGHMFNNLEMLQRHLLCVHKLQMCGLCLEGRKIFIFEQKLYNKEQLDSHSAEGDSEIDGIGEERGGFTGHPLCNFCRKRFYSDNELYQHMSVDHYACHICQRSNPGQYDYFHNYDDLEAHFLHEHALCEHSDCLAKKFVVFKTDAELKRHIALAHGGNMRRSQRNTYLKIPVTFQYRHTSAGQSSFSNSSNSTNVANSESREAFVRMDQSNNEGDTGEVSATTEIWDNIYHTAVSGGMPPSLEKSSFPPLSRSKNTRHKVKQHVRGSSSSAKGAINNDKASSGSSTQHAKTEDAPCSSSVGAVNPSNKQFLDLGKEPRSRGLIVTDVMNAVNIGTTAVALNKELHATEPRVTNSIECGLQLSDEVCTANRALNESIRSRLGDELELFMAFKDLSAQFRRGNLAASLYCEHVKKLGLWDLLPELARLCPEPEKQKSLLNAFKKDLKGKQLVRFDEYQSQQGLGAFNYCCSTENGKGISKAEASERAAYSTESLMAVLRSLDRGGTCYEINKQEEKAQNGYCEPKLKAMLGGDVKSCSSKSSSSANDHDNELIAGQIYSQLHDDVTSRLDTSRVGSMWSCVACTLENGDSETKCAVCETSRPIADHKTSHPTESAQGHGKRTKKVSKFERLRVDKELPSCPPLQGHGPAQRKKGSGAWNNGGGQRLLAMAQREAIIENAWRR